jgi:hypothetical protein
MLVGKILLQIGNAATASQMYVTSHYLTINPAL